MGKKKSFKYKGKDYDSAEEIEFQQFLDDCKTFGYISDSTYQPPAYELIPKATTIVYKERKTMPPKKVERVLYRAHIYTLDWMFQPCEKFEKLNHGLLKSNDGKYYVDVKGVYNLHGGDRIFPIHQKLMYYRYGICVNKLIPKEFFKSIGIVPDACKWKRNRKTPEPKKAYANLPTFKEFEDKCKKYEKYLSI